MDYRSRTEKKKEAQSLQKIGERLVKLSSEQLEDFNLPEELHEAVTFAKTIKSHGALKRQLQFIGTLMRKIDPEPVHKALNELDRGNYKKAAAFKETENWRDELMDGNKELIEEILEKCPGADRRQLTQLIRNAVKEKANNKSPSAYRALFRYLTKIRSS